MFSLSPIIGEHSTQQMYRILPVIPAWVIHIVVYAGDVNILGKNINNTIKKKQTF
jgi:hypothetical protein